MYRFCASLSFSVALFFAGLHVATAQTLGCDSTDACIGNALTLNGANQYVDIPNNPVFYSIDSLGALTVEMWMNVVPQPGKVQIVAGKWGPRTDRDDEWLMLIDQFDTLRFEVSNGTSNAGNADNTQAKFKITAYYNTWIHVAGVWDSVTKSVRLYVNGIQVDSEYNTEYPARSLRRTSLPFFQIGSFNGFLNAPANYQTFDGQMDEIRIWNVARPADSVRCSLYRHFDGTENGLVMFDRCNGSVYPDSLCDASENGNDGAMRNGAIVAPSTRIIPQFLLSSIDTMKLALFCNTDTTVTFTITDTSVCGDAIQLAASGISGITIAPPSATMNSHVPQTFTLSLASQALGLNNGVITVQAQGSCSPPLVIPIVFTRNTPLTLSLGAITYDTLHGCQQALFEDSTLQICNTSGAPLTISSITKQLSQFDTAFIGGWSPPYTLQQGACVQMQIRFQTAIDGTYNDTLHIISNDSCAGSGTVVLQGTMQHYLNTVDSVNFNNVFLCGQSAYAGELVNIANIAAKSQSLTITGIKSQSGVFSSSAILPLKIQGGAKQQILVTLQTSSTGYFSDSLIITADENGCTVTHTIYVQANVVKIDLSVSPAALNFGNVIVGVSSALTSTLKNLGVTQAGAFAFLDSAKEFTVNPPNSYFLLPGGSAVIGVTFTPTDTGTFYDTLYVQDTTCHNIVAIPLQGTGIFGPVGISPAFIQYGAVFNCDCSYDTITLYNNSGTPLTVNSATPNGAGFSVIQPIITNINAGDSAKYVVAFCGSSVGANGGYTGTVTFSTNNATTPALTARLSAVRTSVIFDAPVFTDYGIVEVNTTKDFVINIQNASIAAVCIDSIVVPPGFTVISTNPVIPDSLGSTRIIAITLRFSPTAQIQYDGQLLIYCHCPCAVIESTEVKGLGAVLDISFPWTTIVLPQATKCDTVYRDVGLQNPSHHQITVNSITITGADASAFAWQGLNFTTVPTVIDSLTTDSVRFYFYPRLSSFNFTNATLTIITTTIAGTDTFVVTLAGSLQPEFTTNGDTVDFGGIAVRTAASAQDVYLYDAFPAVPIVIDSIYLLEDAGIFTLTYPPLPVTLQPGDSLHITANFTPLAAVKYVANVAVHIASPCPDLDSSLVLRGSGFTPVSLIEMCFDTNVAANIGDTFSLPVVASRLVPQTPVNMNLIVNYDVNAVRLQGIIVDSCATDSLVYTATGAIVSLDECHNIDSGIVCRLLFRVLVPDSLTASIAIDSIAFAADTTFLQSLIGQGCGTTASLNGHCFLTQLIPTNGASALAQNIPNPASQTTTINYEITEDVPVILRVCDVLGRVVAAPVNEFKQHGSYSCVYDTRNLQPGLYYYTIDAGIFHSARIMSVIR